jgi:sugar phosphate isomerase/epimerase
MTYALCNEVIRELPFAAQCELAARLGYDAIELAPFTLSDQPHLMDAPNLREVKAAAADAGIAIASLHWLLVAPAGLSITSADAATRDRTVEVMRRMIGICAELGGMALVHGSPAQRQLPAGQKAEARRRGADCFAAIADDAVAAGVTYCIEALAPDETNFINTIAEAAAIVDAIGSPNVQTMIDCCAAGQAEAQSPAELIDRWLPSGHIAHVQVNDRNRRGPGQGTDTFAPVLAALRRHNYTGAIAVEPFDYHPDGATAAARAIGYLRGLEEALQWQA